MASPDTSPPSRILFVSHEATRTGAPMFLLNFLRWLRRETGQEFEVLLNRGGPLEPEFARLAPVHRASQSVSRPELFARFGLIYANTCCNGLCLEDLPYGAVPIVTHVHELDYGINACGAKNLAAVVRQSSRYVACAGVVAERLRRRFGIPADRISVHHEMICPETVAANAGTETAETLRGRFGIPKDALVVAACGTVDLRKAPDLFVQLAGRLKRELGGRTLRFLWIGKTNEIELERILRHDVRRLGMEEEFRFVGELAAPHALLALADVFCVTSREDPFPLVMLEAAALGKPMVCFAGAGGAEEFCAQGGGMAVPFLDVPAMAETCRGLLEDPSRRGEFGRRAAEAVRTGFTVEAAAPRLWREIEGWLERPLPLSVHRMEGHGTAEVFSSWPPEEAPEPAYVRAYLLRQAARGAAAGMLASGRRMEAVQALVRAARADIESKEPRIFLEGLVEISGDLAPVDPAKAAYLRSEAERMAGLAGVRLPPAGPAQAPRQEAEGPLQHQLLAK
jgi:glycosyltransferase involved in cell wall biosynthesis